MAAAKSFLADLHKEFGVVTAKDSALESAFEMLRKELEKSSLKYAEVETEIYKDLGEARDELVQRRENAMHS